MNDIEEKEFIMACMMKNTKHKITKTEENILLDIATRPLKPKDDVLIRNNIWLAAQFLQWNCGYNVKEVEKGIFKKYTQYECNKN